MAAADDAVFAVREGIAVAAWAALVWVFFRKAGLSLALIYSAGYVGERMASAWGKSVKLPTLAGMLLGGLALRNIPGPWRDLLAGAPGDWLAALRTVATAVIILRAGMSLSVTKMTRDLRGILLLGLAPGMCEATVVMLLSRMLLDVSWAWGLMAGFMQAAVSPAVVVPAAISLQDRALGTKAGVPTRVLSATCIEVVVAIVAFNVCFRIAVNTLDPDYTDERAPWLQTMMPVLEIVVGILAGLVAGMAFSLSMPGFGVRGDSRTRGEGGTEGGEGGAGRGEAMTPAEKEKAYAITFYTLLGGGVFVVSYLKALGFAGGGSLVCVMMAIVCGTLWEEDKAGKALVIKRLNESWVQVQRALFAAMGAGLDLWSIGATEAGFALALLCVGLCARLVLALIVSTPVVGGRGVGASGLGVWERCFVAIAWLPKATVQAALAGLAFDHVQALVDQYPQDAALKESLRAAAVMQTTGMLSILLTAPLGAMLIAAFGPRWLDDGSREAPSVPAPHAPEAFEDRGLRVNGDGVPLAVARGEKRKEEGAQMWGPQRVTEMGRLVVEMEGDIERGVQDLVVSLEEGKTHLHMTKQLIRFMTTCKARLDSLHDAVGKSEAYAT